MSPWNTKVTVVYFSLNSFNLIDASFVYFGIANEDLCMIRLDYLRGNCTSWSQGVKYQNTFNPLWF
jgi:hypothetical protein